MIAIKLALSLLLVISNVFGDDSDEAMACVALLENFGEHCCESIAISENFSADIKSCTPDSDSEAVTCDNIKCILDKQGILKGEYIEDDAARKRLQKIAEDHGGEGPITERVIRECLDGKYQEYPPEDACPAIKFFTCTFVNAQLGCAKWKSTNECKKIADNAKKCRELVDQ